MNHFLIFIVDGQQFAIDVSIIEAVVPYATIFPKGRKEGLSSGMVSLKGNEIPLLDLFFLNYLTHGKESPIDTLIVCEKMDRVIALGVEKVKGVATFANKELQPPSEAFQQMEGIDSMIKRDGKITLVYNTEWLLKKGKEASSSVETVGS